MNFNYPSLFYVQVVVIPMTGFDFIESHQMGPDCMYRDNVVSIWSDNVADVCCLCE